MSKKHRRNVQSFFSLAIWGLVDKRIRKTSDFWRTVPTERFAGTFEEYLDHMDEPALNEFVRELEKREAIAEAVGALGEEESYKDSEKLRGFSDEEIEEHLKRKTSDDNWDNTVKWLGSLSSPERYSAAFKKVAKLYLENAHADLVNDTADMIDVFLFEHKLSAFSFGDDYVRINYYFNRFRSRVESELVRGRKK